MDRKISSRKVKESEKVIGTFADDYRTYHRIPPGIFAILPEFLF